MSKIGFIGAGNMGSAIMKGVLKKVPGESIYVSDTNSERVAEFARVYGTISSTNEEISKICDFIFLGVKPQMMKDVLSPLSDVLKDRSGSPVLITMAAGLEISTIREFSSFNGQIIRIMPNLPVSVGEGMTLYATSENLTDNNKNEFLSFMSETGKLLPLPESLIDAGCSVSGCGPAFVCLFIEALTDAGVKCGLSSSIATTLAVQTLLGTSLHLRETSTEAEALRNAVCSPGGSTIKGVESLKESGLSEIVAKAIDASFRRNKELGKK